MEYTEDNIVGVRFTSGANEYEIADIKNRHLWFQEIDKKGNKVRPAYSWDTLRAFNSFVGNSFKITREAPSQLYQIY
jgi:hypothetical protein